MATVEYSSDGTVSGKLVITWAAVTGGDDGGPVQPQGPRPLAGAVQFTGTFGDTITLQKSNDGTNWISVADLDGTAIAVTAAGLHEFSTAARYIRVLAGAVLTSVNVVMVLRG